MVVADNLFSKYMFESLLQPWPKSLSVLACTPNCQTYELYIIILPVSVSLLV